MKRLIRCSVDDDWGKCYEYIEDGSIGYTQDQLEDLFWECEGFENEYHCAEVFTEEIPNRDNFYHNSIGFWNPAEPPDREPDYISISDTYGTVSSYWYEPEGVYRESDHWGYDVASCSWFYDLFYRGEDTRFGKQTELEFFDPPVTGFIRWKDLKAKGELVWDGVEDKFILEGFKFE